jgi:hypothetical protein
LSRASGGARRSGPGRRQSRRPPPRSTEEAPSDASGSPDADDGVGAVRWEDRKRTRAFPPPEARGRPGACQGLNAAASDRSCGGGDRPGRARSPADLFWISSKPRRNADHELSYVEVNRARPAHGDGMNWGNAGRLRSTDQPGKRPRVASPSSGVGTTKLTQISIAPSALRGGCP